jgi:superfamily I DNA and RNA helicase
MNEEWADPIRTWLYPPFHAQEQGQRLELTSEQRRHVNPSPNRHQRLRGVAGSGKTLVIAQRAANLAADGKKVLIVTFNITLWHYIHDLVSRAKVDFRWDSITFTHFHGFCHDFLNENGIPWPREQGERVFEETIPFLVRDTIKSGKNAKNRKYDAILIDEGQDFQQLWYEALCEFLTENNEVLFVCDERQNLYKRNLSWIDSMTNTGFRGRWRELKESYRLSPPLLEQVNRFARMFIPEVGIEPIPNVYQPSLFQPHIIWTILGSTDDAVVWVRKAATTLIQKRRMHPQDIVILVPNHNEGLQIVENLQEIGIEVNHVFEYERESHHHKKSFWMNDGRLKACTFHSFKGWELRNVIVLTPVDDTWYDRIQLDYMLYTAITRSRENLIVLCRHSRYQEYGNSWPHNWMGQN